MDSGNDLIFFFMKVVCRWALSVKKNYRPVKYHNWRHALNVCQTMFTMLKTGKMDRFMDDLEVFGLLVACLCHDLDHRGTNNSYQTKVTMTRKTYIIFSVEIFVDLDCIYVIKYSPPGHIKVRKFQKHEHLK